jgi:hypothetical protein
MAETNALTRNLLGRSEFGIKGDVPAVGDEIFLTVRVRN